MIDINKKPSSSLNKNKYKSTIGFTDLLFNLLVGFVYLFIIAFILINPIQKKQDVPKKAEFMVVIEWPKTFNDDIDLWVKSPDGQTVSFVKKEAGLMNLEKDDLGLSNKWNFIYEISYNKLIKLSDCLLFDNNLPFIPSGVPNFSDNFAPLDICYNNSITLPNLVEWLSK